MDDKPKEKAKTQIRNPNSMGERTIRTYRSYYDENGQLKTKLIDTHIY